MSSTSTGYTTISSSNLQLIIDALGDYGDKMGIDFSNNPFAAELQRCDNPDAILGLLRERENAFINFREGNRSLINCFSPAIRVLHSFSATFAEAVSLVSCSTPVLSFVLCEGFPSTSPALSSSKGYLHRSRRTPRCTSIQRCP